MVVCGRYSMKKFKYLENLKSNLRKTEKNFYL